jgi:tetratricopeptide (TPR) repeat protein
MNAAPLLDDTLTVPMPLGEALRLARDYQEANRLAEADAVLRRILAVVPKNPDALHLSGVVAYQAGRHEDALHAMQQAITHGIDTPLYYRNIAELYRTLGQLDQAEVAASRAVALNPGDPIALTNYGIVLADLQRTDAAISCFEQALALDPEQAAAHFGLAEALLASGDFGRGWDEYEWRFRLPEGRKQLPKIRGPQWDGKHLADGRLLLFADQGFGDAIQFGRYLPWAARRCHGVALACSPTLQPILAQMRPGIRLFSEWRQAGTFAAWSPLTSLPRLARTTLQTIPDYLQPLRADPARAARWRGRLDGLVAPGLRRVGIVWAGRPTHKNDRRRSVPLAALAPLSNLDGIVLVVLQKGPAQRQVGHYRGRAPLIHLSAEIEDFADTMAVIDGLDLVVTVDTSVAHLAGAMGKPVWIMLPWSAEWRWLQNRIDSPWYPSARLFRQPGGDDWQPVTVAVADALAKRS